jgi:hypothetical protein
VTDRPPPFARYVVVSGQDAWEKILSGEVTPHIYSSKARGDFEPVPISAAEFFLAVQAGRDADGEPDAALKPYQIMWCDRDGRRPARVRHRIPVPHWVYVMKAAPPARKKERTGPGAAEQYDWADIELFVRKLLSDRGDFAKPENRMDGWRSQNNLIEVVKNYLEKTRQPAPSPTQFKDKVADMLKRIRSELPADH